MTTAFSECMERVQKQYSRVQPLLKTIERHAELREMEAALEDSFKLVDEVERLTLLARALPAYTGHPKATLQTEQRTAQAVPIHVGFTREGWFAMFLPFLLPKKSARSPDYIRGIIYPALRNYFKTRHPLRYTDCVLIFRHVYARDRPERQRRDYDNVEQKAVTDIVALYLMTDDAPGFCSQYHCCNAGLEERTEIFIVPQRDFSTWLETEKIMLAEGVKLYEKP